MTPVSAAPSLLSSQFTVCTSWFTRPRNFVHSGICRGFSVKFLADIFHGDWGPKICGGKSPGNRRDFGPHFSPVFSKKLRQKVALGYRGHKDSTLFLCTDIGLCSPHFGAISLLNYTENLERRGEMGRQHPSLDVKRRLQFRPEFWLEIITSRDAKSACFQGSTTSCL